MRLSRWLLMVGATVGFLQTYALPARWNQGPEGRWWEPVRRRLSAFVGRFDEDAGSRPITEAEFAGSLDRPLRETEQLLWELGFVRNPLARPKVRNGSIVDGSWVYRESPLAPRQFHLMLFESDGRTDVYAHTELSSVNPLCAPGHVRGQGQSVGGGVRRAREWLPLDTSDAPTEPPDVPWDRTFTVG